MNALDPEHVKRSKLRSRDVLDDVLNAVCFVFFVALRTIRVCDFLFRLYNLVLILFVLERILNFCVY